MAKPGVARSDLGRPRFPRGHPSYRPPEPQVCSIEGCQQPTLARGWCSRHYRRWQRHGDRSHGNRSCDLRPARSPRDAPGRLTRSLRPDGSGFRLAAVHRRLERRSERPIQKEELPMRRTIVGVIAAAALLIALTIPAATAFGNGTCQDTGAGLVCAGGAGNPPGGGGIVHTIVSTPGTDFATAQGGLAVQGRGSGFRCDATGCLGGGKP